jgi:hypothetical protein
METVCQLTKKGKAWDGDVPLANDVMEALAEVGPYARESSLKKWSVALDVYPPRHGDHPAFSAKVHEIRAELYQLLRSREKASRAG